LSLIKVNEITNWISSLGKLLAVNSYLKASIKDCCRLIRLEEVCKD